MQNKIRWGLLAPGGIGNKFIKGLSSLEGGQVLAVGSRSLERAQAFASQYHIPRAYGSYEELAKDPDLDIIYIGTPHPFHAGCMLLCLNEGKSVLCEKPFTLNYSQALEAVSLARKNNLFLMEAMWTRFLPVIVKVREWLKEGLIGDVRLFKGDFGFRANFNPESRLFNPELGGGALLDVGIYPISFASMVFGREPKSISSQVHMGKTGVDEHFSVSFGYEDGQISVICASLEATLNNEACIYGTKGRIYIPEFYQARRAVLSVDGSPDEVYEPETSRFEFAYEAEEAMQCLREGKKESSVMPLDETLEIVKTLDTIRKSWNLVYPGE